MKRLRDWLGILSSKSARRTPNDPKRYRILSKIGQGAFGNVYEAKDRVTGQLVAIKKVPIAKDGNAEHELGFNLSVNHKNVVRMLGHYRAKRKDKDKETESEIEQTEKEGPTDMCLVLEHSKTSLRDSIDAFRKDGKGLPDKIIKVLSFQMFRALHYLHSLGIIHRDIKPSNLLIDKKSYALKLSDLGHATRMIPGEPRNTNACSVAYRAPELELANEDYNEKIDIWSVACVLAECYTGQMLFKEVKQVQHYDRIRSILGDPTPAEFAELQPLMKDVPPARAPNMFDQYFAQYPRIPPEALSIIKKTLTYRHSHRPSAISLLADPYFDDFRRVPLFNDLLFDFREEELMGVPPELVERIVPPRCRNEAVLKKISGVEEPTKSAITARSFATTATDSQHSQAHGSVKSESGKKASISG